MAKLLRVRDKILLGLSLLGDIHNEIKTVGGLMGNLYQNVYGFAPKKYKKSNFNTTVSRMLSADIVEKVIVNGNVNLRITSKGKEKISRDFPLLLLQNKKWDRKWRVLTFDISEKQRLQRDNLRLKLKELGFGMLQKSIWISPHGIEDDMREYLISNNLGDKAYLFVSDKVLVGDLDLLVDRLWNVDFVNELYKDAFLNKNKESYFEAILKDPFLPKELLPENWYGDKARSIF